MNKLIQGTTFSTLLVLAACSSQANKNSSTLRGDAAGLVEQHATQVMRMRPVNATRLGLLDADVDARVNDAMDDFSHAHMREWRRTVRRMRSEIGQLPAADIDPLTRGALLDIYTVYMGASEIGFGYIDLQGRHRPYIINQIDQPLLEVPRIMINFQRADNAEHTADYLRRMWAYSSLVTSVLGKFNSDADAGWVPPRPILEGALRGLEKFVEPAAEQHQLVTNLLEKVDAAGVLSAAERARVRNEAITLMNRVVYPAYFNAISTVRERLPQARTTAGVWAQPLGAKFYQHSIRHEAGSDKSAAAIHQLGLSEVARILAEMDRGLIVQGYQQGSVGERMRVLARDPELVFADTSAGREALLSRLGVTAAGMQARLPEYFGRLPQAAFEIKPVPEARQASAAGGFYDGPPADGSGPGVFWINLRDMNDLPWFRLPTLLYHETVPGHHLQIALARSQTGRPMLWRFSTNSAYSEGWALYAERLAAEMGVYQELPLEDLGRLQAELFRAVRLVVDTGLHSQRWSRQQAITYMRDTTGRGEVDVSAEVERYMAWPGQALSYKLGQLELLSMREQQRQQQGESFDLKAFHDKVLSSGPVSMPLLSQQLGAARSEP